MHLGEICLLTEDVRTLAAFYRMLLQVESQSEDESFQEILPHEPMLTILRQEGLDKQAAQRACIAFTVEDVQQVYERLLRQETPIVQPPERKPWGTVNMIVQDPDGNRVYLRQFPETKE